jgi:quercetin dioxygenase-like cupin family protein/DNA-binding XRE family transcriptional regulator
MSEDARVGQKLATVRESLQLTVEQLAERSGCDAALVRRIEAGELVPSLAPLIRLSRGLGVRLGTLLDDAGGLGPVVTRKDTATGAQRLKSLETGGGGPGTLEFFSLAAGKAARHMEPFLVTVHPGGGAPSTHEGEELLYVLDGQVEVAYGQETHRLGPGDSIYYDSVVPHRVSAAGDANARLLAVVYAPL